MKTATWIVLAVMFAALAVLTACSALPVTQGELEDTMDDASRYNEIAIEEAGDGNNLTALIFMGASIGSSIMAGVGLSRRRRKNEAIENMQAEE